MKVRIIVQPSGCLNGSYWPAAGELIDLPDAVAEDMIAAGQVEKARAAAPKVETRPAPTAVVEKRGTAKKAVAKKAPPAKQD